jgi:hypothetical protein
MRPWRVHQERQTGGKPAATLSDEPDPKAQTKEGFVQAYNAQAALDADAGESDEATLGDAILDRPST